MTIAELRALLAKATPGPWRVSMTGYSIKSDDPDVPIVSAVHGGPATTQARLERFIDNADAIAAMRNSYEALLDVAEAAMEYREFAEAHSLDTFKEIARDNLDAALAKITGTDGNTRE